MAAPHATDLLAPPPPHRGDAFLTRIGVTGVAARDALLAGVVLVVMLGLVALAYGELGSGAGGGDRGAIVALVGAQAAVLASRRSRPVVCLALVLVLQVAIIALLPADSGLRGLPPLIAAYTVGTLYPTRRALALTGGAAALDAALSLVLDAGSATGFPALLLQRVAEGALSYPVAALVGLSVATRRRYLELLRLRADEALRAQEAIARSAVVAERARMARELHDVAAHHLSGMVVQAAAVERLVDRDPAAAREGAAWLRTEGKRTLDDLRAVVGVLREGAEDGTAPVPGVADLEELVDTARGLGDRVTFTRTGPDVALGPLAGAAVYRVAQQALANARQHAPGAPVHVDVAVDDAAVSLRVVSAAPVVGAGAEGPGAAATSDRAPTARPRTGVGLVGMRERAQLVGATLDAGPTPDGGWAVAIRLPRDRVGEQGRTTGDDA